MKQSQRHPNASQQDPKLPSLEAGRFVVAAAFPPPKPGFLLSAGQFLWSLSSKMSLLVLPSLLSLERCIHAQTRDFSQQGDKVSSGFRQMMSMSMETLNDSFDY